MDMVNSPTRLKFPEVREPGSNEWKRISWHDAFERIARHMKSRPRRQLHRQNAAGVTVNRWNTMGFLASSSASNESGYLTHKVSAQPRRRRFRHPGTYLTRPHGGQLAPSFGRGAMTNHWVDIKNADLVLSWVVTPPKRTVRLQSG